MKRKRCEIVGTLDESYLRGTSRYQSIVEIDTITATLSESRFVLLPIEVTCLIARCVALGSDARDYQSFMRFLLPMYGVDVYACCGHYTLTQQSLLDTAQRYLKECCPLLYKECLRERLRRIADTLYTVKETFVCNEDQLRSVQILASRPHIELFMFVTHTLCEHCTRDYAKSRVSAVSLCVDCGSYMGYSDRVRDPDKMLAWRDIERSPEKAYRWLSEKKLRRWCAFATSTPIPTTIRGTKFNQKVFYLLKDAIPFIKLSFIDYNGTKMNKA